MRVHAVCVKVQTAMGQVVVTPVGTYESEVDAKKAFQEKGQILRSIAEGKIVVATPNGPRAICSVQELLLRLGITGATHELGGFETESPIATVPSKIVVAKN